MGLLKSFHAITTVGLGFRLLSSTSYFISGFFFVLAWIPHSLTDIYVSQKNTKIMGEGFCIPEGGPVPCLGGMWSISKKLRMVVMKRIKQVLVWLCCQGLLPSWAVQVVFRVLGLKHY